MKPIQGRMMRSIILGLLLITTVSCKEQEAPESTVQNQNIYNWNQAMRPAQNFTQDEVTIGTSICESFEIMRTNVLLGGGGFSLPQFYSENKSCSQIGNSSSRATATIKSSRSSNLSLEVSTSQQVDKDVLNDKHNRLERICSALKSGETPINTIKDGNLRYQINFYSTTDFEWIQIAEFKKVDGRFMPYLIEKAAIMTSYANVATDYLGMTRARTINFDCDFKNQRSYRFQRWFN